MNLQNSLDTEKDIFTPITSISRRHVAACFADIRKFTTFTQVDNKNSKDYVKPLLNGLYDSINAAIKEAKKNLEHSNDFGEHILKNAHPVLSKTLGDGIILVWEYPEKATEKIEIGFSIFILDFIQLTQTFFYKFKSKFDYKNATMHQAIKELHLGFGLSSGYAWRLFGTEEDYIDYAGTIINTASRLQEKARPFGLVSALDFMTDLFLERWSMNDEGEIMYEDLRGLEEPIAIWKANKNEVMLRRHSRCTNSFYEARNSIERRIHYNNTGILALSIDDTIDIFDIREKFESKFAKEAAERRKEISDDELEMIDPEQKGEPFHTGIAKLSNKKEGEERSKFIDWAYTITRKLYDSANEDSTEAKKQEDQKEAERQHTQIFQAIKNGDETLAEELMQKHINDACRENKNKLLDKKLDEFIKRPKTYSDGDNTKQ